MTVGPEPDRDDDTQFQAAVARLKRSSRSAGALSVVGAAIALAALGVSAWQVVDLQARVAGLREEEAAARTRIQILRATVQAEEDKRELARAQLQQDNTAAAAQILGSPVIPTPVAAAPTAVRPDPGAAPGPRPAARTDVARVYFQIRSAGQAARYDACARPLRAQGYRVPQYELVSSGPADNQVRYFHADEKPLAEALAQAARDCLGAPLTLVYLGRYQGVNPRHFEVWLAPEAARPPV